VAGGDSSSNSDLLDSVELLFLEQANKDDEVFEEYRKLLYNSAAR